MIAADLAACSTLSLALGRLLPGPRATWTLVGALAIPLWATWPALAKAALALPTFQFMAITYAVGALVLWSGQRVRRGFSDGHRAGWLATGATVVGSLGSSVALVFAIRFMPPAQAQLISYLWPAVVVLLAGAMGFARVGRWQILGVALGLGGAALVIGAGPIVLSVTGVGFALLSAFTWAAFCVFRLWEGKNARDVLAPAFAVSAIVALLAHLGLETTVWPGADPLVAAVAAGVMPLALGNLFWDQGLRQGDARLLSVMAFATPLASTLLLIGLGWTEPTIGLLLGGLAIVAGGIAAARS